MKKQALKETAAIVMMFVGLFLFAVSFTSCSSEEVTPSSARVGKDLYTVAVSASSSVSTGLYDGDFKGTPEQAYEYMNAGEIVAPGSIVSVSVAKGETLFVKVDSDKSFDLVVSKNGEEVIGLAGTTGGKTYIFSNK
jgi:hypothetical protein